MKIQLAPTIAMPAVGFGTNLIDDKQAELSVTQALEAGYRHIDTAEGYQNEAGVGRAIRATGVSRDDLFVTTKLWPGNPAWGHPVKDRAATFAALDQSLDNLGLDYVDLYLIHAPFAGPQRLEQWEALVQCGNKGRYGPSVSATLPRLMLKRSAQQACRSPMRIRLSCIPGAKSQT